MTFVEFKKSLLDLDMTIPKFSNLIKVSEKNVQGYKKKGEVPNTIAVIVTLMVEMQKKGLSYSELVNDLDLKVKTKKKSTLKKDK
jgi:hypothetical protein